MYATFASGAVLPTRVLKASSSLCPFSQKIYLSNGCSKVRAWIGEPGYRSRCVSDPVVAGSCIQLDVNPLVPLVLHASGKQFCVERHKAMFLLGLFPDLWAEQPVVRNIHGNYSLCSPCIRHQQMS